MNILLLLPSIYNFIFFDEDSFDSVVGKVIVLLELVLLTVILGNEFNCFC